MGIPYAKLGIPANIEKQLKADSAGKMKMTLARGLMPLTPEAQLGVLYLLGTDEEQEISSTARKSMAQLPVSQLMTAISHNTHPKILEFLIQFREPEAELDQRIAMLRTANNRTVRIIALRAGGGLCLQLSQNHERLLVTPNIYLDLNENPNCSEVILQAAESFLRMQGQLPELPDDAAAEGEQKEKPASAPKTAPAAAELDAGDMDLSVLAEVEAALSGQLSPSLLKAQDANLTLFDLDSEDVDEEGLGAFKFDFQDDNDLFSWDLTKDLDSGDGDEKAEARISMANQIQAMTVGQKIKLAYRGNKEVRNILIRDTNKIVAAAVVKSGRLLDQEVATFAGNKNLDSEVLRHIAGNREWTRKYPVKVALVNNPKTPVSTAVSMVSSLQKRDLMMLTRNRNVPSVVCAAANRLYEQKHRKK
jgi:hypothetical protein